MKRKMQCCLALAVFFGIRPAITQNNIAAGQLKMLQQFKGYWQADNASMQADGKTSTFVYSANFITTADNHGLIMTEFSNIPGMGKISATNLIGVSPYDEKVHWFSVDNTDVAHEHVGEFTDSKHFSMIYRGMQNGKEYVEKIMIDLTGSNTLVLKLQATLEGKDVALITGSFHRKKVK